MKILKALALSCGLLAHPAVAQEVEPGMFRVNSGGRMLVNEHGVCRVVQNTSPNGVMVAARSVGEWSTGTSAFINNVSDIPSVTASSCNLNFKVAACQDVRPVNGKITLRALGVNYFSGPTAAWNTSSPNTATLGADCVDVADGQFGGRSMQSNMDSNTAEISGTGIRTCTHVSGNNQSVNVDLYQDVTWTGNLEFSVAHTNTALYNEITKFQFNTATETKCVLPIIQGAANSWPQVYWLVMSR